MISPIRSTTPSPLVTPRRALTYEEGLAQRWAEGNVPTEGDAKWEDGDEEFRVWIPRIKPEWLNSAKIVDGGRALKLYWQKGAGKGEAPPFLTGGYNRNNESLTITFPSNIRAQLEPGQQSAYLASRTHWWSEEQSTYVFVIRKATCTYA